MAIDGTEGGQITLEEGAAMTARYREANPNGIQSRLFGRNCIEDLLRQGDGTICKGIRMYFALNDAGEQELVLVGADADGNDLTELVMDLSLPCPKMCPSSNALNS